MGLQDVVILGAGGFAREVLDAFDAHNAIFPAYNVLGFIVDAEYGSPGTNINDKPILGDYSWLAENSNNVHVICGVGAPEIRLELVERAKNLGVSFCSITHPTATMTRWVTIGEGTAITAGCIFTNRIVVGNHIHINLDCTVGHDVIIEDFVTIAPGAHISGNVNLQEGCFIGTGVNIIEKKTIGAWSIVGAGSTIVDDVPANTTVVGVPGRIIKTRPKDWYRQ